MAATWPLTANRSTCVQCHAGHAGHVAPGGLTRALYWRQHRPSRLRRNRLTRTSVWQCGHHQFVKGRPKNASIARARPRPRKAGQQAEASNTRSLPSRATDGTTPAVTMWSSSFRPAPPATATHRAVTALARTAASSRWRTGFILHRHEVGHWLAVAAMRMVSPCPPGPALAEALCGTHSKGNACILVQPGVL